MEKSSVPMIHLGHPDHHIPLYEAPESASPPLSKIQLLIGLVLALLMALIGWKLEHLGLSAPNPQISIGWILPFATLLACIAIMPFVAKHFWEHYYPFVSVGLGALVALYYFVGLGAQLSLAKSLSEYISFIILLGSLFTISGGILIRMRTTATPLVNTGFLLLGAILANVFGTTGASMLLIRPFLRMNQGRLRPYHVVFFIFAVSNVGGSLTPIGDPPLFLGYLKGVPFWWILEVCWPMWMVAVGLLLGVFLILELRHPVKAQEGHRHELGPTVSVYGAGNLVLISLVLVGVFLEAPYREMLMVLATFGSLWSTSQRIHDENRFNFAPIKEVALLFLGIFLTMIPALGYLKNHSKDAALQAMLRTPGQFYYTTGALSSVLDNAPTYMTFLESHVGQLDPDVLKKARELTRAPRTAPLSAAEMSDLKPEQQKQLQNLFDSLFEHARARLKAGTLREDDLEIAGIIGDPKDEFILMAISLGAVFFGAMTYIGNGPNFMVKSIAEGAGAVCPSFFGYIACYSLPVLLPILTLVWWLFLR